MTKFEHVIRVSFAVGMMAAAGLVSQAAATPVEATHWSVGHPTDTNAFALGASTWGGDFSGIEVVVTIDHQVFGGVALASSDGATKVVQVYCPLPGLFIEQL